MDCTYGMAQVCGAAVKYVNRRGQCLSQKRSARTWLLAALLVFSFAMIQPQSLSALPASEDSVVQQMNKEFHQVAKKVSPAVVHLTTVREVERRSPMPFGQGGGRSHPFERFFDDDFFRRFFDEPREDESRKHRQKGLGSGVIVDAAEGYVLTNYHVVKDTTEVEVKLSEHEKYKGEIVGTDPATDIAVLQIDGDDLPEAKLATGDGIKVGHHVLAIGNPFALDRTVTSGIISATGRENMGINEYESFIQTDAAINPGNSGGPLVNMRGEVIGISTAIFSRSGGYMGIGFAVPAQMVKSVMDELVEHGEVTRGWLGVSIQELTSDLAEALELDVDQGVLVGDVIEDTPAEESGVKRGDVIVELDGKPVEDVNDLRNQIADFDPGSNVDMVVLRDGERKPLNVKIGQRPGDEEAPGAPGGQEWDLGFELSDLTEDLRERFRIRREDGVLIASVERGGPAAEAGLRPGMVILEVNRKPVHDVDEFKKILDSIQQQQKLLFTVSYRGSTSYAVVTPRQE